ncbi:FUSC family protein [Motilimonas sp. KMU-193]|uniref:FUSC family protein n=1 Tax=Motilimonas sp. KMU-193 TaxID=3388668 RepID=UPI00396B0453
MSGRVHIEAAKVAIAIASSIFLALWFGWDKPYWAGITVIVLCGNETFGHSIRKAQHRVFGTILGVGAAWFLIAMFAQAPFIFMACFIVLTTICCFLSFSLRYGYIFNVATSVSAVICFSGGLDVDASFQFSILRLQETLLGVACYSAVYTFIYPVTTESDFFNRFENSLDDSIERIQLLCKQLSRDEQTEVKHGWEDFQLDVKRLEELMGLLTLPLVESYRLRFKVTYWQAFIYELIETSNQYNKILQQYSTTELSMAEREHAVNALTDIATRLSALKQGLVDSDLDAFQSLCEGANAKPDKTSALLTSIYDLQSRFVKSYDELKHNFSGRMSRKLKPLPQWQAYAPKQDYKQAYPACAITAVTLIICFGLWHYLPIPMGFVFPLLAASMVVSVASYPSQMISKVMFGMAIWCVLPILQYLFLLPQLSQGWQLWCFYFINLYVIWSVFAKPEHAVHRLFGSFMLILMTTNATNLTPVYDFTSTLMMLLCLFFFLLIFRVVTMVAETIQGKYQYQ